MNKLTKIEINQYPEPTHDGPLIAAIIQKQGEIIDYIAELEARYESHTHQYREAWDAPVDGKTSKPEQSR
jgi:hypothetical protein